MNRVSVPVADTLKQEVEAHPDDLDLDPGLSDAQRYALLVQEGAQVRRQRVRERERAAVYAQHNASPGYQEHLQAAGAMAFEDGGF